MDRRAEDREALERLLEIYGADRTRWPARERLRFAGIVSEDKAAARLLAEAQALERLLEHAPRASEANVEALKERIVAAALRSKRPQLSAVEGGKKAPAKAWLGQLRRPAWSFGEWPAAAVLAASLTMGVVFGTAGTFDTTLQQVASIAGFSAGAADSSQLALSDEVFGPSEEDLL